MKCLAKVKISWTGKFAYAIGLITTDGNLSKDGRHVEFTSKDRDLLVLFKNCLDVSNKIGIKSRIGNGEKKYFRIQIGDIKFYEFLLGIGLMPAKSKKLCALAVPAEYFADFLRGCIDGDGNINVFMHPESDKPQLRVRLYSASYKFIVWVKQEIAAKINVVGGSINNCGRVYELLYCKSDSVILLKFIYHSDDVHRLGRKYLVAKRFL